MTRSAPSLLAGLIPALVLLSPTPVPAQDAASGMWRPPDLVDAVASFGAVAHDGALYVYGGHVGRTHVHSMENISPGFRRLVLEPGRTWEELARGPLLQGATLVSDGAAIYRVGGMTAANATAAEPEVLRSSRSAARYSIAEDRWEPLPDLPAGRSSHDAVVAGGTLYVVGGWELRGADEEAVWAATVLALDLDDATGWRSIPAPFERRALAAGTAGGRIYALGGLTPDSGPQLRVDVLDIASGEWSRGPDLPPAGSLQGFGVAAASHRDRVFMSQADGKVYGLDAGTNAWKLAANLTDRRFMHRLAPVGDRILAVGGSWLGGHLATIEVVAPDAETADAPENATPEAGATRWPGFLGGRDANVSRAARLPLTWSDDSVAWRIATPGFGQSSPVIWDDTVFLTSLEGARKETLFITAVDLEDGAERWRRTLDAAEAFEWNDYVSKGAPTPGRRRRAALRILRQRRSAGPDARGRDRLAPRAGRRVRDGGRQPRGRQLRPADRRRRGGAADPPHLFVPAGRRPGHRRDAVEGRPRAGRRLDHPDAHPRRQRDRRQRVGTHRRVRRRHGRAALVLRGPAGQPCSLPRLRRRAGHRRRHGRAGEPRPAPGTHRRPGPRRRGVDGRVRIELRLAFRLPRLHLLGEPGRGGPLPGARFGRGPLDPPAPRLDLGDAARPRGSRLLLHDRRRHAGAARLGRGARGGRDEPPVGRRAGDRIRGGGRRHRHPRGRSR